jgi:hypothetical protein
MCPRWPRAFAEVMPRSCPRARRRMDSDRGRTDASCGTERPVFTHRPRKRTGRKPPTFAGRPAGVHVCFRGARYAGRMTDLGARQPAPHGPERPLQGSLVCPAYGLTWVVLRLSAFRHRYSDNGHSAYDQGADSADPDHPFRPIAITDSGNPDHAVHYA